ncbi:ulp2 [Symbiodinium sp. CCMP2456]|nr:ulp2 [Symbiodinium sp. CCMP2456]
MVRVRVLFPELLSGSPTAAGKRRALEMQRLSPPKTPRPGGTRRLLTAVGQPSAEATKGSSTEASKAAPKQAKSARGPKASTELTEVPAHKDTIAGAEDVRLPAVAAAPVDDGPLAAPAAPVEAPLKRRRSACEEAQSAASSGDDDVAFSWSALRVTRRDLACLEEGNMLNDAVVDFFLQLMTSQLLPNSDIHLFSTHFYTRLTAAQAANGMIGWENVKGWTKKTSLFSRKLAIVPINAEMHWFLALIRLDVPAPRLFFLDSLEGEETN